jgi:hypothetical protein
MEQASFLLLILLSVIELPFFFFQRNPVGIFDIYLLTYFIVKLRFGGIKVGDWKPFLYIFAAYLAYLGYSVMQGERVFSSLLLVKYVEHLILALVVVDYYQNGPEEKQVFLDRLSLLFLGVLVYQVGYTQGWWPGVGDRYRLGLPFAMGTSSNPSGFSLGVFIVFHYELVMKRYGSSFLRVVVLVVALLALWLSLSRVNLLAILVAFGGSVIISFANMKRGYWFIAGAALFVIVFYLFIIDLIPDLGQAEKFVKIIRNPMSVFSDSSFTVRLNFFWPRAIDDWLHSPSTFLFGWGYGTFPVVDGTYHYLLANQGIIGFALFFTLWVAYPLYRWFSKPLLILLIFFLVNAVSSDTMATSYRSIQIYIPLFVSLVALGRKKSIGAADPVPEEKK